MFSINYGSQVLELPLADGNLAFDLRPQIAEPRSDEDCLIRGALRNPIQSPPLAQKVGTSGRVAIICDDNTRPTPVHAILPLVLAELGQAGITDDRIRLVIASGSHRPMTQAELEAKIGPDILRRITLIQHRYDDGANLLDLGTTRRGTRIWLNREVAEADFKIGIGNLVPHWPAGWSGGAKILLPGVAGYETVARMHLLGVDNNKLLGEVATPCREEMEDLARRVGLDFIVNTILNEDERILAVAAGDFIHAHREGVRLARSIYGVACPAKADICLSSTHPVDYDLFQADKGIFSAVLATKPGGEIILFSPCCEGISPAHETMASLGGLSNEEIRARIDRGEIGDFLAAAEMMGLNAVKREFRITIVTSGIPPHVLRELGFGHLHPSEVPAYLSARLEASPGLRIGILRDSAKILPVLSERGAEAPLGQDGKFCGGSEK